MRDLPVHIKNPLENNTYKLSEFKNKSIDYITNNRSGYVYIDSLEYLKNNLDLLLWVLLLKKTNKLSCPDYETIKFINKNFPNKKIICSLLDDGKNIDRSYIKVEEMDQVTCIIPLVYLLWGVEFKDNINVSVLQYNNEKCSFSINGNKQFDKEHLKKVKELVENLNKIECSNDIEKNILVSNYIQKNIQYIDKIETNTRDGIYVVDPHNTEISHKKSSLIETVLDENYGICMSIANTTTMLLNNPTMNVDTRSVYGSSHVWNIVNINGKSYYVDNTWSITRNKDKVHDALKAHGFTNEYLLFGERFAKTIGHHDARSSFFDYELSQDNLDKTKVVEAEKKLEKSLNYNYGTYVPFKSKKDKLTSKI